MKKAILKLRNLERRLNRAHTLEQVGALQGEIMNNLFNAYKSSEGFYRRRIFELANTVELKQAWLEIMA